jgi:hypothetical protein
LTIDSGSNIISGLNFIGWISRDSRNMLRVNGLRGGGDNTRFLEKESKLQLVNFVEGGVQITKAN